MSAASIESNKDITQLLCQWQRGDESGLTCLISVLYDELKKIASAYLNRRGVALTLFSPTVLVNEACLKLLKHRPDPRRPFKARAEFFGLVSSVMLSVLADYARSKKALKHGGNLLKVSLDSEHPGRDTVDLMALKEVLARLERLNARQAKIWKCRYLCGLSIRELAGAFRMGQSSIHRELKAAMGWIRLKLERGQYE